MLALRFQFVITILVVCPALTNQRPAAAQDESVAVSTAPMPTAPLSLAPPPLIPPPAAGSLGLDSESRATIGIPPPAAVRVTPTLGLDSESRATIGIPPTARVTATATLQMPLPIARLGLPEPVASNGTPAQLLQRSSPQNTQANSQQNTQLGHTPYRMVSDEPLLSDEPSLAELALPPELLSSGTQAPPPATLVQPPAKPQPAQVQPLPPPPQTERPPQPPAAQPQLEDLPAPTAQPQLENLPAPPKAKPFDPLDALPLELLKGIPTAPPASGPAAAPSTPRTNDAPATTQTNPPAKGPGTQLPQPAAALPGDRPNNRYGQADNDKAKEKGPTFFTAPNLHQQPLVDELAYPTLYSADAFAPSPINPLPSNPWLEASPYREKHAVPVQRPWVELWRPLYSSGIYPPAKEWFGKYNLAIPHFMVYGDYRTGAAINRNAKGDFDNWASRLNLDMDLKLTATERLHAFMGPLDRNADYTRLDFTNKVDFVDRTDIRFDNLFFEGDAGAMWGGWTDQDAPFDFPFTVGFLPVFYQNGIWAADNVIGAACAIPAKNSPLLKWTNYDATFFWASDQVNSDAFLGDNNAAEFFGTAWFIEAYDGYIEADYAFVHDDVGGHRSYHNMSVAYTRRYFYRVSNSIRYITNFGQSLPSEQRTADGHMLLLENSLISKAPNTIVPYLNFFYGQGRTQSLARAAAAGGILNNTGINFETDGLTGYPTLDATGVNATGAALGINMLGADFQHQLILELAALSANGAPQFRNAPGDQYAAGVRYQKPLSNAWIFRTDHMVGWRENARDLRGSRVELRWKF